MQFPPLAGLYVAVFCFSSPTDARAAINATYLTTCPANGPTKFRGALGQRPNTQYFAAVEDRSVQTTHRFTAVCSSRSALLRYYRRPIIYSQCGILKALNTRLSMSLLQPFHFFTVVRAPRNLATRSCESEGCVYLESRSRRLMIEMSMLRRFEHAATVLAGYAYHLRRV